MTFGAQRFPLKVSANAPILIIHHESYLTSAIIISKGQIEGRIDVLRFITYGVRPKNFTSLEKEVTNLLSSWKECSPSWS